MEEIIAVMRAAGETVHGARVRALVVILWRAGLRINEARQLGQHAHLGVTSTYLQGIDTTEIINTATPAERR